MATSTITNYALNSNLAVTSAPCQQIAAGTVTYNSVRKTGNVCVLTYDVAGATIGGNGGSICRLSEAYRPSVNQYILANVNYAGVLAMQTLIVQTDGYVKTAIGSNTVTAVYIRGAVYTL